MISLSSSAFNAGGEKARAGMKYQQWGLANILFILSDVSTYLVMVTMILVVVTVSIFSDAYLELSFRFVSYPSPPFLVCNTAPPTISTCRQS